MEHLAKIVKVEKVGNQFWNHIFTDIKTGEEDCFLNNYPIRYTPNLVGKLKLLWDNKQRWKLYQDFNQNIADLKEAIEEENLGLWEEKIERKITKSKNEITRRPSIFFKTHEEKVELLEGLYEIDRKWKKTAKRFKRTDRTLRNWRKESVLPPQKEGPKFKIDRKSFYHLIHFFQTGETKTLRPSI